MSLFLGVCAAGQNSPGPGSYSFATAEKPFTRIKAGFAAGLDRFQDPSGGPRPGPGAYKGAVAPSMVKQSFNITYDDSKLRRFL